MSARPLSLGAAHDDLSRFHDSEHHDLIERRSRHLGLSLLFYDDPLHLVRGDGATLWDSNGRSYLDAYNNVASVGHCNERVVDAMAAQAATHTTHTRYLDDVILDYAERLADTLPDGLDRCVFVNSGSEANDLALQMAFAVTGARGVVVVDNSYHGNSELVGRVSLMGLGENERTNDIAGIEPPNRFRGPYRDLSPSASVARLDGDLGDASAGFSDGGHGLAAFMCDGIFDSQGGLDAPDGWFAHAYSATRAAGGLCIADEVQAGFARTGTMWGFSQDGVVPDIVTFGKPAGNGYPLAGLVTTTEIMDEFAAQRIYFNTFGGSPVAAAVGSAVLDEINDRRLVDQVKSVGEHLRHRLNEVAERHEVIGEVRGRGLYQGIDLVADDDRTPHSSLARLIPDAMRQRGVLMGMTGRYGNVLKIRPPLIITREEVDRVVDALDDALADTLARHGAAHRPIDRTHKSVPPQPRRDV